MQASKIDKRAHVKPLENISLSLNLRLKYSNKRASIFEEKIINYLKKLGWTGMGGRQKCQFYDG